MKSGGTTEKKLPADAPEVTRRVNEKIHLVRTTALKLKKSLSEQLDLDELRSMGHEGLLHAARSYDAERGVPFGAWAYLKIRGAILDGLRKQGDLPREVFAKLRALEAANRVREGQIEDESAAASETAESADARITATASSFAMAMATAFLTARRIDAPGGEIGDESAGSPEQLTMQKHLLDQVRESIAELPENERSMLTRVYFEDQPLDETAKGLGLSKSWGSRLHARALEHLARDLKRRKINDD
jgi:RNA polymerase sigma factor for flagellar operon FliA